MDAQDAQQQGREAGVVAWQQLAGEPDKWFARFEVYRTLGPRRTLAETYRLVAGAEGLRGKRPGKAWTRAASRFAWQARATAWDHVERARLRKLEVERRFDAREVRLGMIDRLLEAVFGVLIAAEVDKLGREEARLWLPTLRVFFKDLLAAQRNEWRVAPEEVGAATDATQDAAQDAVTLRADDLLAAQAALERWQAERARLLLGAQAATQRAEGRAH